MSAVVKRLTVPRELMSAPDEFLNPTLLMFVLAVVLAVVAAFGYFSLGWYKWISFVLNMVALHLVGTVIHDACHNVAHRNRIINAILGHGSALMLCFSFPVFTRVHMQHHAHVNDPENDPDHIVSTAGPLWFINARFLYHEFYFFRRKLWRKFELGEWIIARSITAVILLAGIKYGFLGYIFDYWFVPLAFVGLALGLFFDYLPHRPFKEQNRWKNARVYPSRVLNWLIMGQNYHLIHHLWPSIPWYNYERAYHVMRPLLDAKGCHQTLGLLETKKDFWNFIYDVFIGIRLHRRNTESMKEAVPSLSSATISSKEAA